MPIEAVTGAINLCAKTVVFPPTLPEFMELCRGNLPRREPVVSLPAPIVHISNEAEEIASREYPKPANGFGTWWAKRILRLEELGQKMPLHSIQSAQQVLGVKTAVELRESEDPEARAERAAIESESV
jgi:hypothetical protein